MVKYKALCNNLNHQKHLDFKDMLIIQKIVPNISMLITYKNGKLVISKYLNNSDMENLDKFMPQDKLNQILLLHLKKCRDYNFHKMVFKNK